MAWVVAQLAELLFPTLYIGGLNLSIGNFYNLCQLYYRKDKNKRKRGMDVKIQVRFPAAAL